MVLDDKSVTDGVAGVPYIRLALPPGQQITIRWWLVLIIVNGTACKYGADVGSVKR